MAIYKEDLVDIELSTGVIHRAMLAKTIGYADAKHRLHGNLRANPRG